MAKVNDVVWVVSTEYGIRLYTQEKYAREEYMRQLDYYKKHKPDANDRHSYRVWHEVDEDDMHYALVESNYDGVIKNRTLYYEQRMIIK